MGAPGVVAARINLLPLLLLVSAAATGPGALRRRAVIPHRTLHRSSLALTPFRPDGCRTVDPDCRRGSTKWKIPRAASDEGLFSCAFH